MLGGKRFVKIRYFKGQSEYLTTLFVASGVAKFGSPLMLLAPASPARSVVNAPSEDKSTLF